MRSEPPSDVAYPVGEPAPSRAGHASSGPAAAEVRVTPMMAQYCEIKAANPDCLLFYRMGDFYELFFADAEVASRVLGIVLTKRGKHLGEDIAMCGVPLERGEDALQRLIAAGHRVAVCEQTEDPAEARRRGGKSVVRRDVVRLVTPGTLTEERLLDPGRPNLLVALTRRRAGEGAWTFGLAHLDISTGRFGVLETDGVGLPAELARLDPREIVVPDALLDDPDLKAVWRGVAAALTPVPRDGLDPDGGERRLRTFFGVATLEAFGSFSRVELAAAGAALAYVERTQYGSRPALSPPTRAAAAGTLQIDPASRASLELLRSAAGGRSGSLVAAVDRTVTAAGARLLAERLSGPLTDLPAIAARHGAVETLVERRDLRGALRADLAGVPDFARAAARLQLGRGGPRDLAGLRDGLAASGRIGARLGAAGELPEELSSSAVALQGLDPGLAGDLRAALADALPLLKREGGFIRPGYDPALDEARDLAQDSRRVIAALQSRYAGESGHRTLRIKHNNVLGYFVEVPSAAGEAMARERGLFVHRQTMAGAMRFTTAELGELEARIASAAERGLALELAHFERLVAALAGAAPAIARAGEALARIDVAAAAAELAEEGAWTRPRMETGTAFRIRGGRHPVVEAALKRDGQPFIANDCELGEGAGPGRIVLVTGPNMGGKSTYLRQAAILAILAQAGLFVPALAATIGVVDRLFSRVGAADDLARGRSTFMVEMVETAAILNQASERSLVILDEMGRGTSTFDGLSIAWAAIEHLHDANRCRALFATHFHELTALAERLPRLSNAALKVTEFGGDVVFLHEVVPGTADRSYGLQVARLAGLPSPVVARARTLLTELERSDREHPRTAFLDDLPLFAASRAAPSPQPAVPSAADPLRDALGSLLPDEMTPREALDALYRLQALARS